MVSNDSTTPELDNLLESVILKEEIRDATIQLQSGSEKGDGYAGIMTSVQITGIGKDGQNVELNIMAKRAPQSTALRNLVPIKRIYEREVYFYEEFKSIFEDFERKWNVKEKFGATARCFGFSLEDNHETILLENLRFLGYRMWDRMKPMDEGHVKLILDKYAHLHAFSFAIRDQQPEVFEEIMNNCEDQQSFEDLEKMSAAFDGQFDHLIKAFCEDSKVCTFLEELKSRWLLKFKEVRDKNKEGWSVVNHGDCWCNNMMFKYQDENNPLKPTDVVLLDWQIAKMANVCNDLCYFFYCNSSQNLIDKDEHFADYYYSRLAAHVEDLGSKLEDLYPLETFKEHWMVYRELGIIVAVMLVKIMLTKKEEAMDLSAAADSGKKIFASFIYKSSNDELYLSRMKGLIVHFVDSRDQDTRL